VARSHGDDVEMIEFKRWHAIALIVIAALAVYANTLWNGFAYDDVYIIQRNTRDLGRIWLTPYWPSFGMQLGLYRPFAIFAFAIEWAISGGAPWLFHLVNILLHAGVCVLAYLLIERLFSARAAFAGALVFAIHPVHTEAVANVVGQNELWAGLGVLGACLVYVTRPDGVALGWKRTVAIFGMFSLALLAKESAVVLPGLLVLLDVVQRRVQFGGRSESVSPDDYTSLMQYIRRAAPFFAGFVFLFIGYLVLRHSVLGNLAGTDAAPGLPHLREEYRLLNAFRAWPEFVRLSFFPLDLSVDYSPATILPAESLSPMIVLGILLVVVTVLLMLATPLSPRAGLVAGWFLITLLPVSNFFFPIGVLIAERTLYIPSLAVCCLAGYAWEAAARTTEAETRKLALGAAVVIVLLFGGRTVIRNPDWDSTPTVWASLLRDHPESYRSQWLNALNAWHKGQNEFAERYFQIAETIWPRDSQMLSEFGNFYIGQRKYDKAISYLERSRNMTEFVPRTHQLLAYAYLGARRSKDALATARHAATMEGSDMQLNDAVIAGAHEQLGQYPQAIAAWQKVVKEKRGDMWLNWAMLARAQATAGRNREALQSADRALAKTSQELTRTTAQNLKAAIADGCYDRAAAAGCDPLLGWQIGVTTPVTNVR
jgi:tetratricopeptide (TPR) repeat protein